MAQRNPLYNKGSWEGVPEEELALLRDIASLTPHGLVVTDATFTILHGNQVIAGWLDIPQEALPGMNLLEYVSHPEFEDLLSFMVQDPRREHEVDVENFPEPGKIFSIKARSSRLGSNPVCIFQFHDTGIRPGLLQDFANLEGELRAVQAQSLRYAKDLAAVYAKERRAAKDLDKTQDQLLRSDKLATMGQLAAGIAHDINAKISASLLYSQMLLAKTDQFDSRTTKYLQRIHDASLAATKMLRQILDFTRKESIEKQRVPLYSVLQSVLDILNFKLSIGNVEVNLSLDESLPEIWVDASQMEQVFTNLLVNASDAMPEGGHVAIRAHVIAPLAPGELPSIEIEIADDGPGIPEDIREKVFEPFFTTKERGKGTGLGLFICHGIIERHGGVFDLAPPKGNGTTFIIRLPLPTEKPENGDPVKT